MTASRVPGGKALVLGHDTRAFLACVRSLARAGVEVHAACCPPDAAARRSRHLFRCHDLPPFGPPEGAWLPALERLVLAEGFDLVLPVADPTLVPLHHARDRLAAPSRYALPPPEAFEAFFDKAATSALARSLGVRTPEEEVVRSAAEIPGAIRRLGMPLFVKPRRSFLPERPDEKLLVRRFDRAAEAGAAALDLIERCGSVLLQSSVPGRGVGVEVLCRDGEVLLSFAHLRLHEPREGGGSSHRRGVPVPRTLLGEATRICRAVRHTGVAMFEYRVDPARGTRALLEVNGRFWGSLPLALASGADFPRALFDLLVRGRAPAASRPRTDLRALALESDFSWWLAALRGRTEIPPLRAALAELPALLALRQRIDSFAFDDPAPAFAEAAAILRYLAGRLRDARALSRAKRNPAGAADRLAAAARSARSFLFVCKGNIHRSPFAARLFARLAAPGIAVASAGHHPESGRPCPPSARAHALALGVDLLDHRSAILTPEALRAADLVIVFDGENLRAAAERLPEARGRIHLLGVLDGEAEIPDPAGMDEASGRALFRRVASLVERLARERAG